MYQALQHRPWQVTIEDHRLDVQHGRGGLQRNHQSVRAVVEPFLDQGSVRRERGFERSPGSRSLHLNDASDGSAR